MPQLGIASLRASIKSKFLKCKIIKSCLKGAKVQVNGMEGSPARFMYTGTQKEQQKGEKEHIRLGLT